MSQNGPRAIFVIGISFVLLTAVAPAARAWPGPASPPPYLTTTVTQSGVKQATLGGYPGVFVNNTSSSSSSFSGFVYLDLVNSAGQTVYWGLTGCNFAAGQTVGCFVEIFTPIPAGTYTATVFATATSSVPVSVPSTLPVTF